MPKFYIDHGTEAAARFYASLDGFTRGYIEALFFTDASDPDDGELAHATVAELAPETIAKIIGDCETFQSANAALLDRAYQLGEAQASYDDIRAGRDFWFTRNGHGVGFWDRGLGEVGELLTEACRGFRMIDLYQGDDSLIYLV